MKWSELPEGLEGKIKEILYNIFVDKSEGISDEELYVPDCDDEDFEFGDKTYYLSATADVPYYEGHYEEDVNYYGCRGEVRFFDIHLTYYGKATDEEGEIWLDEDYNFDISNY